MLKRSSEKGLFWFVLNLSRKVSALNKMLVVGYFVDVLYKIRFLSIFQVLEVFIMNRCWNLPSAFFLHLSIQSYDLLPQAVYIMHYINWFLTIEPALYTWNKSCLGYIWIHLFICEPVSRESIAQWLRMEAGCPSFSYTSIAY